jgi:hypothetical protein
MGVRDTYHFLDDHGIFRNVALDSVELDNFFMDEIELQYFDEIPQRMIAAHSINQIGPAAFSGRLLSAKCSGRKKFSGSSNTGSFVPGNRDIGYLERGSPSSLCLLTGMKRSARKPFKPALLIYYSSPAMVRRHSRPACG